MGDAAVRLFCIPGLTGMDTEHKVVGVGDMVRWVSYGEERRGRVQAVQGDALLLVRLDGPLEGRMTIRLRGWVEKDENLGVI